MAGKRETRRGTGPRGEHDREAFLTLVTETAEGLLRAEGLRGLGMRRLAGAIGYAPNSIYNAVGDLDQVVLRVNARTFGRLRDTLVAATRPEVSARDNALALADAYLAFVAEDPAVWSLVSEYTTVPGAAFPDWYAEALSEAIRPVDAVLAPLIPEAEERRQAVAALWAALHGLAALSTSRKLAMLTAESPRALGRMLVGRFLG
ncbi:TetR/AcrR family transcriptional regulator [Methylobacterium durans]|uniref:TetR/AcrR family transcriptional regulator n=1 Tax=Methylobacterium durans TaxID=2202825 RepID=UPI001F28FA82|nr:WHG domain-containing protein [Methylobacterium durans]